VWRVDLGERRNEGGIGMMIDVGFVKKNNLSTKIAQFARTRAKNKEKETGG